ncbi:MAG: c-type cytochrome [Bacillota bacterium]
MKNKFYVTVILAIVTFTVLLAKSQGPTSDSSQEPNEFKKGEEIVMKGTVTGATACFACHGSTRNENLTGAFPRIAGQPQMYLTATLEAYVSGQRKNDIMEPIAKAMSSEERQNVAAYYSHMQPGKRILGKKTDRSILKRGESLAKIGDQKILVQACNNCHGPGGIGMGPAIPYLAGQFGTYISMQLNAWKDGKRTSSANQMLEIAKRLSEKDIASLAAYFDQLQTTFVK